MGNQATLGICEKLENVKKCHSGCLRYQIKHEQKVRESNHVEYQMSVRHVQENL